MVKKTDADEPPARKRTPTQKAKAAPKKKGKGKKKIDVSSDDSEIEDGGPPVPFKHIDIDPRAQTAFNRCPFGIFTSLAYANAGPAHFCAACDLMNLFFVFDEKSDEASGDEVAQQVADIMNALRYPMQNIPGENILGAMARSFWKRTLLVSSPSSAQRIIRPFSEYTDAVHQQAMDRDQGHIRSIPDFFLMTDDVPDSVVDNPHIERLACAAIDMTILANVRPFNPFSRQVLIPGDEAHNMVAVVMVEKNLTVQEAVDHIGEQYRELSRSFCEDMETLPTFPDPLPASVTLEKKGLLSQGIAGFDCYLDLLCDAE
ncbi:isoprenoid synthase domain-containing protein [Mycena vulgaris]|nr:isoprenoid synthase domain-containing protein [Mycena vulgaris]